MKQYPVIDGHNDLAWAAREARSYSVEGLDTGVPEFHTDLPRLREGGVAGQFWSVWVDPVLEGPEQVVATLEQIDFVQRFVERYSNDLAIAQTASEARAAMNDGKIASFIGVEGGAQFGGSLASLRQFVRLGARYMTLTWSRTIDWADSATDAAVHGGLSEYGRAVVREMNRIGMLVDLAHVAPSTMRDALEVSQRPVMVSHSGAYAMCQHDRNVPDDVLRTIGERDGVVMVAFVPSFLSEERRAWVVDGMHGEAPPVGVGHVADHLDHMREVAGVHAVGIGADYDGTDAMPEGLDSVAGYPALFEELERRGWSERELMQLGRDNVLRVVEASDPDYVAFREGRAPQPETVALTPAVSPSAA